MRSTGANTRMIPGALALGSSRPRRKITPRSYSRRIFHSARRLAPFSSRARRSRATGGRAVELELLLRLRRDSHVRTDHFPNREAGAIIALLVSRKRRRKGPGANQADAYSRGNCRDDWHNARNRQPPFLRFQEETATTGERLYAGFFAARLHWESWCIRDLRVSAAKRFAKLLAIHSRRAQPDENPCWGARPCSRRLAQGPFCYDSVFYLNISVVTPFRVLHLALLSQPFQL
jgi:hypothetical protein